MNKKVQISESIELGILLALSGGFMDAYSYIGRGGVFANAQTGKYASSWCTSFGRRYS